MKTLTRTLSVALLTLPVAAQAHPQHDGQMAAPLHVVEGPYEQCFFDLAPELTQDEFNTFAKEAGLLMRFHQVDDAETLGRGKFDLGVTMSRTGIDDSKGAWNNTMAHPDAEHYLGHAIQFPRLVARMGVADRVDVGLWGSKAIDANYGFIGAEAKVGVLSQRRGAPVSVAVRPSLTAMVGPKELWAANISLDVSVSRTWRGLSPYAGVALSSTAAFETTTDVDLDPGHAVAPASFAGLAYQWRAISVGAEAEAGVVSTVNLRAAGAF